MPDTGLGWVCVCVPKARLGGVLVKWWPCSCSACPACEIPRAQSKQEGNHHQNNSASLLEGGWGTHTKFEDSCLSPHGGDQCCAPLGGCGVGQAVGLPVCSTPALGMLYPFQTLTHHLPLSSRSSPPAKRTPSTESHRLLPRPRQRNLPRAPSQRVLLRRVTASR